MENTPLTPDTSLFSHLPELSSVGWICRKIRKTAATIVFWLCLPPWLLATATEMGFRLVTFESGNSTIADVITGNATPEQITRLPINLEDIVANQGFYIDYSASETEKDVNFLLTFYPGKKSLITSPGTPTAPTTQAELTQLIDRLPRGISLLLNAWPAVQFHRPVLPEFFKPAISSQTSIELGLDNIAMLARWILGKKSTGQLGQEEAEAILNHQLFSEQGDLCSPAVLERWGAKVTALGYNVLSACMLAGTALNRPDLFSWILEEQYKDYLPALLNTPPPGRLNVLHISVWRFPHYFRQMIAAYQDPEKKTQAIRQKTHDGFNVLMRAITDIPEQVATVLTAYSRP